MGQHAGLVQDVDDLPGQPLQLVVEVVREVVDPLVRAFDPPAHLGDMLGLLDAELVELGADLPHELFQLLFEGRPALEVIEELEEDEDHGGGGGGIDQPGGEARGVGRGHFLREQNGGGDHEAVEVHGAVGSGGRRVSGGGGAGLKDLTALGGKVGSAGPGVEAEEGVAVEVGRDGAKLLTLGAGETNKDAVLQPGQAKIDSIETASQQVVSERGHIRRGPLGGGIDAPGLGLMENIVNKVNELRTGLGQFRDHRCVSI